MRKLLPRKLDQNGITHHVMPWAVVFVMSFSIILTFRSVISHAAGVSPAIKSGVSGYCLDDHNDSAANNAVVDSWGCNDSGAQDWALGVGTIEHGNQCLAVKDNGTSVGDRVVLDSCDQAAGQVWLRDQSGLYNPNSGLCLSLPNATTEQQVVVASCSYLSQSYEVWTTSMSLNCTDGTEGNKVACSAIQEWTRWQSGKPSHEALLNSYTDGAPYEEWCADFVSYIYKEAGFPFTGGETNGWDENIADNIQNMGFTYHQVSGYTPKAGDVAYFDYAGGHVEIVISGGTTPSFIYGNSAIIDPATGNGEMEANTIANRGAEGQLLYYLSPNY